MDDIKILIVDGYYNFADCISDILILEYENIKVRTSRSIKDAIKLLKTNDFNLVITDIDFDKYSGNVIIRWIRKNRNIPIIVTTELDDNVIEETVEQYLRKPYKLQDLRDSIKEILLNKGLYLEELIRIREI